MIGSRLTAQRTRMVDGQLGIIAQNEWIGSLCFGTVLTPFAHTPNPCPKALFVVDDEHDFLPPTSDILLEPRLSLHERSSPARASYRNALCRVSVQHAGQTGLVLSVGKSCENDKGVSHGSLPIYVKYDTRRSRAEMLISQMSRSASLHSGSGSLANTCYLCVSPSSMFSLPP